MKRFYDLLRITCFYEKTANYWVLSDHSIHGRNDLFKCQDRSSNRFWKTLRSKGGSSSSWMKEGWSPYSEETHLATIELLDSTGDRPDERNLDQFLDPAWYVFFFIPISFVPYGIAKAIWMTLSQLSVVVSIYLAIHLSGLKMRPVEIVLASLLGALFYPFVRAGLSASMAPVFVMFTLLAIKLAFEMQGNQAGFFLLLAFWMNPIALFITVFLMIYLGGKRDSSL